MDFLAFCQVNLLSRLALDRDLLNPASQISPPARSRRRVGFIARKSCNKIVIKGKNETDNERRKQQAHAIDYI